MSETYTVLRDMSRTGTDEPFRGRFEALGVEAAPAAQVFI